MLGAAPELPSVPAATIDASNQAGLASAVPLMSYKAVGRTVSVGSAVQFTSARAWAPIGDPSWGLTDKEREERAKLAQQAADCLDARGFPAYVATSDGTTTVTIQAGQTDDGTGLEIVQPANGYLMAGVEAQLADSVPPTAGKPITKADKERAEEATARSKAAAACTPKGLYAPSAKAKLVNDDEVRRAKECLDAARIKFTLTRTEDGLQQVTVPKGTEATTPAQFFECAQQASSQALAPYVAPPAQLFLGSKSTFNLFSAEGMLRTAATALGVMLIAALVMLLTGRRLVRPIVALTGAAQRMRNGDHAARVPVTGKDEVARLGHAFNAMAESIQRADFQRKAMVSDVAHELRTPLANIKGYLVASEDGVVPLDAELVTSLLEETGLLEHLVADLQDLALADAGMLRMHPAERNLTEIAQQVVLAHRPAAEAAGVTLTADVPAQAMAAVDNARMRQALGNLVANAIRFTPTGGTVVVGVRPVDDGYNLTVTDNGAGIAEEHLPHLFDRFYRAEQSRSRTTGGSGLGLAITKHLIEAHQGTITVTSRLNSGSVFTAWIPRKH
ncbi:HAMP domain-containing histidine kinase [Kribbella sandramycini]|nr:HAMP domain-containing histidine kinase [Kribbella sandramycini]